jgi:predicted SnoaL-like aldol condensation-catalyzing enzyme
VPTGRRRSNHEPASEWVDDTVSGHTQIDGPTEPTDLDKTEENKALVAAFVNDVLKNGRFDKLTDYVSSETYIQHNPQVGDGLEGLGAFVDSLTEEGLSMVYEEIHTVVGCGNLVAVLSKMNFAGTDMAVIDLFRVHNGLIVEHRDVIEEIPPIDQWVNSGKF